MHATLTIGIPFISWYAKALSVEKAKLEEVREANSAKEKSKIDLAIKEARASAASMQFQQQKAEEAARHAKDTGKDDAATAQVMAERKKTELKLKAEADIAEIKQKLADTKGKLELDVEKNEAEAKRLTERGTSIEEVTKTQIKEAKEELKVVKKETAEKVKAAEKETAAAGKKQFQEEEIAAKEEADMERVLRNQDEQVKKEVGQKKAQKDAETALEDSKKATLTFSSAFPLATDT